MTAGYYGLPQLEDRVERAYRDRVRAGIADGYRLPLRRFVA